MVVDTMCKAAWFKLALQSVWMRRTQHRGAKLCKVSCYTPSGTSDGQSNRYDLASPQSAQCSWNPSFKYVEEMSRDDIPTHI
eukprot:6177013-Pleurochrysis_carterae.AAC.2